MWSSISLDVCIIFIHLLGGLSNRNANASLNTTIDEAVSRLLRFQAGVQQTTVYSENVSRHSNVSVTTNLASTFQLPDTSLTKPSSTAASFTESATNAKFYASKPYETKTDLKTTPSKSKSLSGGDLLAKTETSIQHISQLNASAVSSLQRLVTRMSATDLTSSNAGTNNLTEMSWPSTTSGAPLLFNATTEVTGNQLFSTVNQEVSVPNQNSERMSSVDLIPLHTSPAVGLPMVSMSSSSMFSLPLRPWKSWKDDCEAVVRELRRPSNGG